MIGYASLAALRPYAPMPTSGGKPSMQWLARHGQATPPRAVAERLGLKPGEYTSQEEADEKKRTQELSGIKEKTAAQWEANAPEREFQKELIEKRAEPGAEKAAAKLADEEAQRNFVLGKTPYQPAQAIPTEAPRPSAPASSLNAGAAARIRREPRWHSDHQRDTSGGSASAGCPHTHPSQDPALRMRVEAGITTPQEAVRVQAILDEKAAKADADMAKEEAAREAAIRGEFPSASRRNWH